MKLTEQIEAVENAVTFLEALGYKSGDVHDDLQAALDALRKRKTANDEARRRGEAYSRGLDPAFRIGDSRD